MSKDNNLPHVISINDLDINEMLLEEAKEDKYGNAILPDGRIVLMENHGADHTISDRIINDILSGDNEKNAKIIRRGRAAPEAVKISRAGGNKIVPLIAVMSFGVTIAAYKLSGASTFTSYVIGGCAGLAQATCVAGYVKVVRHLGVKAKNRSPQDIENAVSLMSKGKDKKTELLNSPIIEYLLQTEEQLNGLGSAKNMLVSISDLSSKLGIDKMSMGSDAKAMFSNQNITCFILEYCTKNNKNDRLVLDKKKLKNSTIEEFMHKTVQKVRQDIKSIDNLNTIIQCQLTPEDKALLGELRSNNIVPNEISAIIVDYASSSQDNFSYKMKHLLSDVKKQMQPHAKIDEETSATNLPENSDLQEHVKNSPSSRRETFTSEPLDNRAVNKGMDV